MRLSYLNHCSSAPLPLVTLSNEGPKCVRLLPMKRFAKSLICRESATTCSAFSHSSQPATTCFTSNRFSLTMLLQILSKRPGRRVSLSRTPTLARFSDHLFLLFLTWLRFLRLGLQAFGADPRNRISAEQAVEHDFFRHGSLWRFLFLSVLALPLRRCN